MQKYPEGIATSTSALNHPHGLRKCEDFASLCDFRFWCDFSLAMEGAHEQQHRMVHYTESFEESGGSGRSSSSSSSNSSPSVALVILNHTLPHRTPFLWKIAQLHICADGGANRLYNEMPSQQNFNHRERFVPEYILGDMDSIDPAVKDFYSSRGTKIIDKSGDEDTTDLHKCVTFIKDSIPTDSLQIVVVGALGGRFDHEMGNLNVLYRFRDLRIVLSSDENLIFLLPAGYHHELRVKPGAHCGLIPVGAPSQETTTKGLRWNLNATAMAFGSLVSTSNIIDDEIVTVDSDVDLLWTKEIKAG